MYRLTNLYADFETINDKENLRVRSWAIMYDRDKPISKMNYINYKECHTNYGIDVSSFINFIENLKGQDYNIYFNNMRKFDGYFILPELIRKNYKFIPPYEVLTMTKKDILFKEEQHSFLILKNIAMERALKLLKRFKDKVPKDKTKRMAFLKRKWNVIYPKEYKILISDNKIYSIKIGIDDKKKNTTKYRAVNIKCFLSLFSTSVGDMGTTLAKKYSSYPKEYFLKGKGDYTITKPYRNIQELENDTSEFNYLLQDCFITLKYGEEMAKIIPINNWKLTTAGTAYSQFLAFYGRKYANQKGYVKKVLNDKTNFSKFTNQNGKVFSDIAMGKKLFKRDFPTKWLSTERHLDMRKWYKGGIVLANEKHCGQVRHNTTQIDITSSYPNIMNSNFRAPYGEPRFVDTKSYDFKFYRVVLKRNVHNKKGLPFIADTSGKREWPQRLNKNATLHLTTNSIDLFKKYYDVDDRDLKISVEYCFKSRPLKDTFSEYVNHYFNMKNKNEEGSPTYIFSKLMNNALYGKFGTKIAKPITFIVDNKGLSFTTESKTTYYLPLAIVITELARLYLVNAIENNFDKVIYVDTDSASIIDFDKKDYNLTMGDGTKLGEWTYELKNKTMIARRAKQYAFWDKDKLIKIKLSGFNAKKYKNSKTISYIDFLTGWEFEGQTQGIIYWLRDGEKHYLNGCYIETIDKILPSIWDHRSYKPRAHQKLIVKNDYLLRLPNKSSWNSSLSG